jgi:DNA-binding CsgD family transcriptional regulator
VLWIYNSENKARRVCNFDALLRGPGMLEAVARMCWFYGSRQHNVLIVLTSYPNDHTMTTQAEVGKKSPAEYEKEIGDLRVRVANQDLELTRVSIAIAEKTSSLRNLLDQIHALDIDTSVKRVMTDSCLSLIETETIEKRLNMELTESDSVFLSKLQKKHANLNQRELRISLLVKLNYDTREIGRSVGISTRGMESIRYRMHKKLCLGKHQSIKTYLSELAIA